MIDHVPDSGFLHAQGLNIFQVLRTATASEPFLHRPLEPAARLMGLPPMGLSGLSGLALCGHAAALPPGPRQGRATSSPMVGTLRNLDEF